MIRYSLFLGNAGCLQNTLLLKQSYQHCFLQAARLEVVILYDPLQTVPSGILSHGIS